MFDGETVFGGCFEFLFPADSVIHLKAKEVEFRIDECDSVGNADPNFQSLGLNFKAICDVE